MTPALHIARLDYAMPDFAERLAARLERGTAVDAALEQTVRAIIDDVRERGDAALLEYTNRFDRRAAALEDLIIDQKQLARALRGISEDLRAALQEAADRIRAYHEREVQHSWRYTDDSGATLGQQITPLERVGVYVPGGKAAYPSSVLMNVIPAKVAGVGEIVMVSPAPEGELNPLVLAAAAIAGVDRAFAIGGAQAIAALAYGTRAVPAVDKIVGPGNRYVAEAKRLVFGTVGIDMIAGPSEVVVIADGSGDPDWVALDLFAQAEHDEDASAVLICSDAEFCERVATSIDRLLPELERSATIAKSLEQHGALITVPDLDTAATLSNCIAPEHLELAVRDPEALLPKVRHAGAIFLGHHSAEVLGDYCAGPNHVLPTARTARFSSPLGVYDFQKRSSLIGCTPGAAAALGRLAAVLAEGEGLTAHARAAACRVRGK
jgi:histidinol dehydrogenase